MNKEIKAEIYISPEVMVIDVDAPGLMCSSITGMQSGSEQDDSTF